MTPPLLIPTAARLTRATLIVLFLSAASRPAVCAAQGAVHAAPPAAAPLAMSLTDALARLGRQHPRLAGARAQAAVAQAQVREAMAGVRRHILPTIDASFATQRLAENQFTAIARRAGLPPQDPDAGIDPFSQVFGSPNTRTAQVTASIRPFDGGVAFLRTRAARHTADAAEHGVAMTRAGLELEVVTRYADARLHAKLAEVADSSIAQAARTLAVTRRAFEAGRVAEFDVLRAEAALEGEHPPAIEARRGARLAMLALRQLLELPPDVPVELVSSLEPWSDSLAVAPVARSIAGGPRLALAQMEGRTRAARAERGAAWRAFLPTIDVQLVHQQLAYPQLAGRWRGPWFPNTTVAAVVSLPLDLSGQMTARAEAASAGLRASEAELEDARRVAELDRADVALALDAAQASWVAAIAGARAAERALQVAEARYEVGRSSLLDVHQARLTWQQAQATRARAARDRLVTHARAERLDRLPIDPMATR